QAAKRQGLRGRITNRLHVQGIVYRIGLVRRVVRDDQGVGAGLREGGPRILVAKTTQGGSYSARIDQVPLRLIVVVGAGDVRQEIDHVPRGGTEVIEVDPMRRACAV